MYDSNWLQRSKRLPALCGTLPSLETNFPQIQSKVVVAQGQIGSTPRLHRAAYE